MIVTVPPEEPDPPRVKPTPKPTPTATTAAAIPIFYCRLNQLFVWIASPVVEFCCMIVVMPVRPPCMAFT